MVIFFLLVCFYEFYNLIIKIGPNKVYSVLFIMFIGLYLYFLYVLLINLRTEFNEEVILILNFPSFTPTEKYEFSFIWLLINASAIIPPISFSISRFRGLAPYSLL